MGWTSGVIDWTDDDEWETRDKKGSESDNNKCRINQLTERNPRHTTHTAVSLARLAWSLVFYWSHITLDRMKKQNNSIKTHNNTLTRTRALFLSWEQHFSLPSPFRYLTRFCLRCTPMALLMMYTPLQIMKFVLSCLCNYHFLNFEQASHPVNVNEQAERRRRGEKLVIDVTTYRARSLLTEWWLLDSWCL